MGLFDKLFGKKSKPDADFSNVQSGSSTTARPASVVQPPPVEAKPAERTWTVRPGDSLSKIALEVYGDANRWRDIYEANRGKIDDPDLIQPGQEFVLPRAG